MSNSQRRLHTDIAKLPEDLRRLIERLLIDGATFEDVVEALEERDGDRVTLSAVQDLFRCNPELQQKRIRRQLEVARALKKAVGNPRSGREQLVQALILTGMMRLNRREGNFEVKDAVRTHQQEENQRLRQEVLRLTQKNLSMKLKVLDVRLKNEADRRRVVKARVSDLQESILKDGAYRKLHPQVLQRIREIYGLVSESKKAPASAAQAE